jgi:prenyl protein peptidase
VPLFLTAQTSNTTIIFLTPIIFGLAHVHHFYEFRLTHPHTPLVAALLRTLLQFTYTTLFGGYATFLFLRTGSLLSAILVHAFCNWMGFPRFWGRVEMGKTIICPDLGEGKRDDRSPQTANGQLNIVWTLTYYSLLVVGAVSWWKLIWTLTDSDLALSKF